MRKGKNFSLKYIKNFNKEKFNSPILLSDGSIITPNMEYLTFEKDILSGFADYKIEKNYWFDANIFILIEKYIQNYGENFQIIFLLSPYHPEVWKVKNLPVVNAMKVVENKIWSINKFGIISTFSNASSLIFIVLPCSAPAFNQSNMPFFDFFFAKISSSLKVLGGFFSKFIFIFFFNL